MHLKFIDIIGELRWIAMAELSLLISWLTQGKGF